jgi:hypothetical protein
VRLLGYQYLQLQSKGGKHTKTNRSISSVRMRALDTTMLIAAEILILNQGILYTGRRARVYPRETMEPPSRTVIWPGKLPSDLEEINEKTSPPSSYPPICSGGVGICVRLPRLLQRGVWASVKILSTMATSCFPLEKCVTFKLNADRS